MISAAPMDPGGVLNRMRLGAMNSKWLSAIERLPEVHKRLQAVQIENQDFKDILRRYDTPHTLFFLDPPYPRATRGGGRYAHELTDADHRALADLLLNIQGRALLTTYPHPIYDCLAESGWRKVEWKSPCYAAGGSQPSETRITHLWMNPIR